MQHPQLERLGEPFVVGVLHGPEFGRSSNKHMWWADQAHLVTRWLWSQKKMKSYIPGIAVVVGMQPLIAEMSIIEEEARGRGASVFRWGFITAFMNFFLGKQMLHQY